MADSMTQTTDLVATAIAEEMWDLIQTCYVGPKLRREIPRMAQQGDCSGILTRCRGLPGPVGRSISASGQKPIESVLPELERLHRVYQAVIRIIRDS